MRFISTKQVMSMTTLSASTLRRAVKNGTFPQPRKRPDWMGRINHNSPKVWVYEEVEDWMQRVLQVIPHDG